MTTPLHEQVAVVAGATRGAGRGIGPVQLAIQWPAGHRTRTSPETLRHLTR
jgi:hypothetical protein